jgi:hypothetical protein
MSDPGKVNAIDRLAELCEKWPFFRALVSLMPYTGGAADVLLQAAAAEIRADRLWTFFDELGAGKIPLTRELIETEDFLHCYTNTVRAVANTRQRDKIRLLACLLRNSLLTNLVSDPEDYEFLLSVVDELSLREFAVLRAIELYEERYYEDGKFSDKHEHVREGLLQTVVEEHLGLEPRQLPDEELSGIVIRLNRTGCYTMMGWRKGPAKDCFLTSIYFKLKKLISDVDGSSIVNCGPRLKT